MNTYPVDDVLKVALKLCLQPGHRIAMIVPIHAAIYLLRSDLLRHVEAIPTWILSPVRKTQSLIEFDSGSVISLHSSLNSLRGFTLTHAALYYSHGLPWPWSDDEVLMTIAPAIRGDCRERIIYMTYR